MNTRFPALLLALAFVPALQACPSAEPSVFYEDFETTECAGVPCSWSSVTTGSAPRWVETIPGLHGMELPPGTGIVSTHAPIALTSNQSFDRFFVAVTAACGRGSTVNVSLIYRDSMDAERMTSAIFSPTSGWESPPLSYQRIAMGTTVNTITGITISTNGDGTCVIDDIDIRTGSQLSSF